MKVPETVAYICAQEQCCTQTRPRPGSGVGTSHPVDIPLIRRDAVVAWLMECAESLLHRAREERGSTYEAILRSESQGCFLAAVALEKGGDDE